MVVYNSREDDSSRANSSSVNQPALDHKQWPQLRPALASAARTGAK
jgi:hypothetical protein